MENNQPRGLPMFEIRAHIAHDSLVSTVIESEEYKSLTHNTKVEVLTETIVRLASMAKWESLRG